NHDEKDERFVADIALKDANPEEFDAVMLPGGALNADKLRMETAARDIVQQIDAAGKPIAAICHAPWLLVSANLVKGRRLTSFYTLQDDIRCAGGQREDQEVIVDKNWVTSRKPDDIPAFNREMRALFAKAGSRAAKGQLRPAAPAHDGGGRSMPALERWRGTIFRFRLAHRDLGHG